MNRTITDRLESLRELLDHSSLQACIIPTCDPHLSEYTADCWKFREYLSGFTGSAGTLVVGFSKAGLWTDSRYFLQAEEELKGTGIELFKMGTAETPAPEEWIFSEGYLSVGLDGSLFSAHEALSLSAYFTKREIRLNTEFEPYTEIWPCRPLFPKGEIYPFPEEYGGESTSCKTERLRKAILQAGAEGMPLAALDEIGWLLNLRGEDVDFNPVGICYAFIDQNDLILFADTLKIKEKTTTYLEANKVKLADYESIYSHLQNLDGRKILLDKSKTNYKLYKSISSSNTLVEQNSPVSEMKAIKNPVEISGFKKAMIKDGIALTRFWMWLEKAISQSESEILPNEWEIGEKLAFFRKEQKNYVCESFCPIVGFNEHGAIVHYEATPNTACQVNKDGFLLIDTGGQYLDGTTDITRSWSFHKKVPAEYKEDYTSLLKGVIALSRASFPAGTRGTQLDILARQFIWERGINFWHGTGHGVGHFLNVHEGPQSIRMNENPTTFKAGMVTSNEPGIYRPGKYGIRIENLLLTCEKETTDFGRYLSFETLTLFPFDLNSIEKSMLTPEETTWINQYHQTVYEKIAPGLNKIECQWLHEKTKEI